MKPIKPVRTAQDHRAALREIKRLWEAKPGSADADRLDVLVTLVEAYEAAQFPMDTPDPIDAIKFRMEQMGLTRKDLEDALGSRARVAEVLNRKRDLSINMIRRLNVLLGIPADILIRPGARRKAA
ncbi:MAG TPA: helix-turn-helix domain-containing protein [Micropepsaceae bacterium]|nr:helix-turn-helix domain-containing protein [Micropepsaceae bacterium]